MKRFFHNLRRVLLLWESWDVADYRYVLLAMDRATKALQKAEGVHERGMRIDIDKMVREYAANRKKTPGYGFNKGRNK